MATIKMSGGQTFDISESYATINQVVQQGWDGTLTVTDAATAVQFTVKAPNIVAVQP